MVFVVVWGCWEKSFAILLALAMNVKVFVCISLILSVIYRQYESGQKLSYTDLMVIGTLRL